MFWEFIFLFLGFGLFLAKAEIGNPPFTSSLNWCCELVLKSHPWPIAVSGETLDELSAPLVHTNVPWKRQSTLVCRSVLSVALHKLGMQKKHRPSDKNVLWLCFSFAMPDACCALKMKEASVEPKFQLQGYGHNLFCSHRSCCLEALSRQYSPHRQNYRPDFMISAINQAINYRLWPFLKMF